MTFTYGQFLFLICPRPLFPPLILYQFDGEIPRSRVFIYFVVFNYQQFQITNV